MSHTTTDYLFVLRLYGDAIPLSRLLFHLETTGSAERTVYLQTKLALQALAQENLVTLSTQNGIDHVRLTELGRQAADIAASAMANRMVQDWQHRSLQLHPPYRQPA